MSSTTPSIAFEIAPDVIRAVARTSKGVRAAQRERSGHDADDARALAKDLGITSGRCAVAISRSEAILKTIELPENGLPDHEAPSFVALMMERQLPFPIEQAAIDFVRAPHDPPALLAAAVQRSALEAAQEFAKGAGFRASDAVLVDEGLARLLAPVGERGAGVMGVFVGDERCEVVIARDGRLLLSRSCELPADPEAAAQTVVTETRRTLMSYRVRPDAVEVGAGAILADDETLGHLRSELEPELGLGAMQLVETGVAGEASTTSARLAGVLALGDERIDFASPTMPPDRNARVRQFAMLAVLAVIVVVGGMITLGLREKRTLDNELATLEEEVGSANRTALGLIRASGRLEHARAWSEAGADWSAHLDLLASRVPSNEVMLLDRLAMGADSEVDYTSRGSRAYSDERWTRTTGIAIGLSGRATDAPALRAFREALIALDAYTLTPIGEDAGAQGEGRYPVVGGVTLRSDRPSPEPAPSSGAETEAADG